MQVVNTHSSAFHSYKESCTGILKFFFNLQFSFALNFMCIGGVGVLFVIENDEIITCDFEEKNFYIIGINTCINCCLYCVTWRGK